MRASRCGEWIAAWERGQAHDAIGRGLILLGLAAPTLSPAERAALPIGDRDRRLLALRASMFGPRLAGLVACSECGERLELDVPIDELLLTPPTDRDATLAWHRDDLDLRLRLPDSEDLRATAGNGAAPCDGAAAAARALILRCIVSARRGGADVDANTLSPAVLDDAAGRIAAADPQADLRLAMSCAACGARCHAPFDIVSFLWAELEAWAERTLWEVHTLAQAYGWTERQVLALGTARRAAYLRMVLG